MPPLAVIVLIRNEADIFPAFASHLAALFDVALFLDHGSTDGTSVLIEAACRDRPGWIRWQVTVPGLHQGLFASFALRHVMETTQAGTVFFLDADEFIDVPDQAALRAALAQVTDARGVPMLTWRNAVPAKLRDKPLSLGDAILVAPNLSEFVKAVVPRALFDAARGDVRISAGNHVVYAGDGLPLVPVSIGAILHLPLRSVRQMTRKTIMAALAHHARSDRAAHEGGHRFDGLRRIAAGTLGPRDLLGWAAAYGEDGAASAAPRGAEELRDAGFVRRALDVAHAPLDLPAPDEDAGHWASVLAAALLTWRAEPSAGLRLELHGTILRGAAAAEPPGETLEQLRAERDRAREELALLRSSTSWRVTAPVRRAMRALGRG